MRTHHSFKPSLVILPYFLLLAIGVVEVWSSSYYFAYKNRWGIDYFLNRELIFVAFSVFLTFLFSFIDYRFLKKVSPGFVVVALLLLVLLHIAGTEVRGATRWIDMFGLFMFEPSAVAEVAILIYVADFISRKSEYREDLMKGVMPVALVVGLFVILIAFEPDIGTAALLLFVFSGVIYVFGYKLKHAAGLVFPSFLVFAMLIYSNPQKLQRVVNFFITKKINYQVEHALIALGSGGFFGQGIAAGRYKSIFIPDSHNDFIMAGIGEDFGFLGVLTVVVLLGLIVFSIFMLAKDCKDRFGSALAFGIGLLFALQAIINLFSVLHLFPPKGITMPFLSYGGTNLAVDSMLLGVVLSIYRRCPLDGEEA